MGVIRGKSTQGTMFFQPSIVAIDNRPRRLKLVLEYPMVVYDLICEAEHPFEGWFPSAEGYEKQAARRQISCPVCGTTNVVKLPHACAIHTKKEEIARFPSWSSNPTPDA